MTKPSDFILNTDYLTIAQTGHSEYTITFPPGTLQPGETYSNSIELDVPAVNGAIDRILIKLNDEPYFYLGNYIELSLGEYGDGAIYINRLSPEKIQITQFLTNHSEYIISYESNQYTIKITTFKPPNVL
jgi:hypothetical protein